MNRRELVQKVIQGGTALVILPSVLSGCSKDSEPLPVPTLPVLTTASITSIGDTSASGGGNITSDGGAAITVRGVCWSTTPGPTTALGTKTADGTGSGTFTSSVTGLTENTEYFIRAYATNSVGTAYGNELNFTTTDQITLAGLTTAAISLIGQTIATGGGNISSDGGSPVTSRGVCWSTTINPTASLDTKTIDGTGTGAFTSSITGLSANTTYYVRAYATNSAGTSYGDETSFKSNLENKLTLDLSLPQNSALNTAGGSMIFQNIIAVNTGNDNFIALSSICTHQGCTVGYDSGAANIKCPCHGSVYATTGLVINGPAPLALQAYEVSKADNILTISL